MDKAAVRRVTYEEDSVVPLERPRWRILPPEIVHIIMGMLGTDRRSLSSCALVSREFTFVALCFLGRHITVNTVARLQECANLLANASAFQHVRSLDLGIPTKKTIHKRDWENCLIILEAFARRRTLNRLWFSELPFCISRRGTQERTRNVVSSLATTVNELGLYSCHFSCYEEMISLIRAFPLCSSLYVRDCAAPRSGSNTFAPLPQHTLHINNLELTSSSGRRLLVDVSNLVKDASLDISSLAVFSCEMNAADVVRHALMIATASPVEELQLVCDEAEGFHVLADPAVTKWPLRSITIGPLLRKDSRWCGRALELSPNLPYLESITLLAHYDRQIPYRVGFWWRLDQLLSRQDLFPRLERLDICLSVGPRMLRCSHLNIIHRLSNLSGAGKVYFWGVQRTL